jgi:hypothetical protein
MQASRPLRAGALVCSAVLPACSGSGSGDDGNGPVYAAWLAHRSHVTVTASGSIAQLLGSAGGKSGEHEAFLLHLRGAAGHGLTVRVAGDVARSGQLPLSEGESVRLRGDYVYDPLGGTISVKP